MTKALFDEKFFAGNRRKLRQAVRTYPIVLTANGRIQRAGDEAYKFQQDGSFWYLTGADDPDIILVIDKDDDYLIVTERHPVREAFDGAVDFDGLKKTSGVSQVLNGEEGRQKLTKRLKRARQFSSIAPAPAYLDFWGIYTNPARAILINKIKTINPEIELNDISQAMAVLRMVKQAPEIEAIQHAINITADTIGDVIKSMADKKYKYEYEVEADITRGFRLRGAEGHGFTPVIASGQRACTLHYVENNHALGGLMVMDVGATANHYSADITRTISCGLPSKRQREVYEAVLDAQEFGLSLVKPGALIRENEEKIEKYIGEKLRQLRVIKTDDRDDIREYYPHALSHFLGLNLHDVGDYNRPLEPGMVLTVEPGIYIKQEGIGVRIEDDVLVTASGSEIMTAMLPKELG